MIPLKIDNLPALARVTVEHYVRNHEVLSSPSIPEFDTVKAGVFVTIKAHENLRGCIGTILATADNVILETQRNAISAAFRDPRFPPVNLHELVHLNYEVSILHPPEPIKSVAALDTLKYGVIVHSGQRRGLLLPDLEGIDTPEKQVNIAMQKAGIRPGEPISLERFQVDKYHETSAS